MANFDGGFDPLEFFLEEIKSTEKTVRLNAIKNVNQIAFAIGPAKTMSDLIPCLSKAMDTEPGRSDEEFLYTIAEQSVELRALNPSLATVEKLVPILSALCEQEETVVHDKAVDSLCKIMESTTATVPGVVSDLLFPRLKELAEKDWFTGRVSACGLFPTAYKYGTEEQKTLLRKMYGTLCGSEETPMVRRAAAAHLKDFVAVIEKQGLLQDMIPIYKALSQEETQDTIRISCLQTALVIAKSSQTNDFGLGQEELKQHIVGVVVHSVDDRSWRVRLTLAKNFDALCKAFGNDITAHFFIDPLVQLLKDQEVEVRTQALKIIEPCLEILSLEQLQNFIVPELNRFLTDQAHQVRAAVAVLMGPLAKTLGREQTLKLLLPISKDLMKDEFHEVRLNMVCNTATLCEIMGLNDHTQSFVNSIQDLIMDNQWRVRSAVIQQVPRLATLFGHQMFQQSKMEQIFVTSLNDSVQSVRHTAIQNHKEIATVFGSQWTISSLLPKLIEHYSQNSGYSHRLTTLLVLPQVIHVMSPEEIVRHLFPILIQATSDSVANVRFCACQQLKTIVEATPSLDGAAKKTLKDAMVPLKQDPDIDVQFYGAQVLKLL